ncbi:MAG: hypothetical protein ABI212_02535 [Burkholderiaceae bacterium]
MLVTWMAWANDLSSSALTFAVLFGIIAGDTFFPAIAPATGAGGGRSLAEHAAAGRPRPVRPVHHLSTGRPGRHGKRTDRSRHAGLDTVLLAMAMAALGLCAHVGAIRQTGVKPLPLGGNLIRVPDGERLLEQRREIQLFR